MSTMTQLKRPGGQRKEDEWLVITEIMQPEDDLIHSCGGRIDFIERRHPICHRSGEFAGTGRVHIAMIPFCPHCEEKPDERGDAIDASKIALFV